MPLRLMEMSIVIFGNKPKDLTNLKHDMKRSQVMIHPECGMTVCTNFNFIGNKVPASSGNHKCLVDLYSVH